MTAEGIPPAVTAWAERTGPDARVVGCTVRPLAGGSVAHADASGQGKFSELRDR